MKFFLWKGERTLKWGKSWAVEKSLTARYTNTFKGHVQVCTSTVGNTHAKGKRMAYTCSFKMLQRWWGALLLGCDPFTSVFIRSDALLKIPAFLYGHLYKQAGDRLGKCMWHKRSSFVYNHDSFLSMLSLDRVGNGMETESWRQTQEKPAPFISILLSATINCFIIIHLSYSQEMILWLFVLWVSNTDFFKKPYQSL